MLIGLGMPVLLDSSRTRSGLDTRSVAIDPTVQSLQGRRAQGHDDGAEDEQRDAAFKVELLEDGIGIPGP